MMLAQDATNANGIPGGWDDLVDSQGAPERLYVSFGLHPKRNERRSVDAGRPVYDDVEYVQVIVPGDKNNVVHRPATDLDRRRFARQYQAFRAGNAEVLSGTPLSTVPWITRAQVEELAYFKVRTLEQLASMSDANASNVGPIQQLRARARDTLALAAGTAPLEQARAEIETQRNELEALKRQLKEVLDANAELRKGRK